MTAVREFFITLEDYKAKWMTPSKKKLALILPN
jgi:hypothetical protein